MGDGGALSPVSRLVSHVLLYLAGDQINTLRGAASRQTCTVEPDELRSKIAALHVII